MVRAAFQLSSPDEKILTKEDEYTLIRAVQEQGSERAMSMLLEKFESYIYAKALPVHRRSGVDLEDLVQEGRLGFMKAVEDFDFDKEVRLATYAGWWVYANIEMYEKKNKSDIKTPRTKKGHFADLFNAYRELIRNRGVAASVVAFTEEEQREFIEKTGHSINEVLYFKSRRSGITTSFDAPLNSDPNSDFSLYNTLQDKTPSPSEALERASEVDYFYKIFEEAPLTERERHILKERYLQHDEDKSTLEDLSKIYGVSRERIRQIEVKALQKLTRTANAFSSEFNSKLLFG